MHTLLNPGRKLLAIIPGLPYCPMPSDQLLWSTPQPALPARFRLVSGPTDRANPEVQRLS
jgi:hypothetical protein